MEIKLWDDTIEPVIDTRMGRGDTVWFRIPIGDNPDLDRWVNAEAVQIIPSETPTADMGPVW